MKAAIPAALCLLFAATGAASAGEGLLGRLFGGGSSTDVPKSIWQREKDASGIHLQSRLKCPASAGSFRLTGLLATDGFGFDVWCQYDTATRERITVFLTRRQGESLEDHFEGAKTAIITTVPGAAPVASSEQASFTTDPAWLAAVYGEGRLRTGVWVTDFSGWTFKFRGTYPPAAQQEALDAMAELADVAAKSAGAHLSACLAATAPERPGKKLETVASINALSVFAGIQLMADNGQDPQFANPFDGPTPPIWCVEKTSLVENRGLVYWRNIAGDGKHGPVDRVTPTALNEAPALEVIADEGASRVERSRGLNADSTIHIVAIRFGDQFETYAFFVDRPDLETIGALADQVFTHQAPPLSVYDKKTRRLNVSPLK